MPSHESVRHFPANAFESEYAIYAYRFGNSSSNRFTKIALKSLETLLSDISTIPLLQLDQYSSVDTKKEPEDFLVNVPPLITVLEKEWPLSVSTVHHSISPSLNSHHGLFAINCISKGNYISEIKGSICHMKDLDCKYDSLSVNPCLVSPTPNSYVPDGQLVLPPFVFKFPFAKDMDNGLNNLFLDSRFNGNFDGRYVRSYCGGGNESIKSKCNAFLRTVVLIHVSEIETRPKIRNLADSLQLQPKESEMPLLINDRIRLCLIATRNIEFGEEIVLEPSPGVCYFPCICSSAKECLSQRTVEKIEDFRRFHFGGKSFVLLNY
ncbi:hypothetical protein BC833DRAFT_30071 [Globomyces pollinis-pini]|nr:hypothetical protein BC833DRAFT_30071 [Globomyces pollinis-pini]